jgi:hypothetical protein
VTLPILLPDGRIVWHNCVLGTPPWIIEPGDPQYESCREIAISSGADDDARDQADT